MNSCSLGKGKAQNNQIHIFLLQKPMWEKSKKKKMYSFLGVIVVTPFVEHTKTDVAVVDRKFTNVYLYNKTVSLCTKPTKSHKEHTGFTN